MNKQELKHYGILGMKWGIRRSEAQLARDRGTKANDDDNEDRKTALTGKSMREMSNKELESYNRRIQLEKQYAQLNKKEVSKGQKFVEEVLTGVAKSAATSFLNTYVNRGVNKLKSKIDGSGALPSWLSTD